MTFVPRLVALLASLLIAGCGQGDSTSIDDLKYDVTVDSCVFQNTDEPGVTVGYTIYNRDIVNRSYVLIFKAMDVNGNTVGKGNHMVISLPSGQVHNEKFSFYLDLHGGISCEMTVIIATTVAGNFSED